MHRAFSSLPSSSPHGRFPSFAETTDQNSAGRWRRGPCWGSQIRLMRIVQRSTETSYRKPVVRSQAPCHRYADLSSGNFDDLSSDCSVPVRPALPCPQPMLPPPLSGKISYVAISFGDGRASTLARRPRSTRIQIYHLQPA